MENRSFHQNQCHICKEYDYLKLNNLINKQKINKDSVYFLNFIYNLLPKELVDKIKFLINENISDNLLYNWGLSDKR